jgi:hypothetical protein
MSEPWPFQKFYFRIQAQQERHDEERIRLFNLGAKMFDELLDAIIDRVRSAKTGEPPSMLSKR